MSIPQAVPIISGAGGASQGTLALVGGFGTGGLSTLLTAGSLIGTAVQTLGVIRQSQASSAEADFRAQIAANNAQIAENNAIIALQKGEADVADVRRDIRQRIGAQRAQLAAQGFDVSEGSSIDILGDTAALGELDVLRIEADAENRAENFRQQGANFQAESTLGTFAAKNIKKAGTLKATSTLITGVATAGLTQLALKP